MIHTSFLVFADNIVAANPDTTLPFADDLLQKIGFFSLVPGCLTFLFNTCRWLAYELWPVVKRTILVSAHAPAVTGPIADQRREEARLLYSGAFVVSILACIVFLLGVNGATSSALANWNNRQVLYANVAFITCELTLSVLAMRTVKFEMVESLYALIEAKKTYVRYISHELRTVRLAVFLLSRCNTKVTTLFAAYLTSTNHHTATHPLCYPLTNPPFHLPIHLLNYPPTAHEHRMPRA
jgi:hypothetical protein